VSLTESIEKGQRDRQAMIRRFGFVPTSVLRLRRGTASRAVYNLPHEQARLAGGAESPQRVDAKRSAAARAAAEERLALGLLGSVNEGGGGKHRTTVSVMAAELVEFFTRYYGRAGQTYIDPFAGHGVRMQVAWQLGLHYYGMDACAEYVDFMDQVIRRIDDGSTTLRVIRGDSRRPDDIPDGIGDLCFTSPPYFDTEIYGPEAEQIGRPGTTYDEFLSSLASIAQAWRPKFRDGAWLILNVNDLRRDGRFLPYHADSIRVWTSGGFELVDTWIVDGLVGGLPKAFAVSWNLKRIAPKVHEYGLVFRAV
jgi:hypothetical protein